MFLGCPKCNEMIKLGKNMADGWYDPPTRDDMNEFYEKHHQNCDIRESAYIFLEEQSPTWDYVWPPIQDGMTRGPLKFKLNDV